MHAIWYVEVPETHPLNTPSEDYISFGNLQGFKVKKKIQVLPDSALGSYIRQCMVSPSG